MPPGARSAPRRPGAGEPGAPPRKARPVTRHRLTLANELAAVGRASEWLRALAEEAGLDAEDAYRLDLCAGELLTNVVEYAYEDRAPHSIELDAAVSDREVRLEIADDGRPFDPVTHRLVRPAELLSQARWGGWGLRLVRQFADEYRYERRGDRNVVSLVLHRRGGPHTARGVDRRRNRNPVVFPLHRSDGTVVDADARSGVDRRVLGFISQLEVFRDAPYCPRRGCARRLPHPAVRRRRAAPAGGRAEHRDPLRAERTPARASRRARFGRVLHDRSGRLRRRALRDRRQADLRVRRRGRRVPGPDGRRGHAVRPAPVDPGGEPQVHGDARRPRAAHQRADARADAIGAGAQAAAARARPRAGDPGRDAAAGVAALPRARRRRLRGADPGREPGRRRLLRRVLHRPDAPARHDRRCLREGNAGGAPHGAGRDPAAERSDPPDRREARPAAADGGAAEPAARGAERSVALRHHVLRAARHGDREARVRERRTQRAPAGARRRIVRAPRRAAQPGGGLRRHAELQRRRGRALAGKRARAVHRRRDRRASGERGDIRRAQALRYAQRGAGAQRDRARRPHHGGGGRLSSATPRKRTTSPCSRCGTPGLELPPRQGGGILNRARARGARRPASARTRSTSAA